MDDDYLQQSITENDSNYVDLKQSFKIERILSKYNQN